MRGIFLEVGHLAKRKRTRKKKKSDTGSRSLLGLQLYWNPPHRKYTPPNVGASNNFTPTQPARGFFFRAGGFLKKKKNPEAHSTIQTRRVEPQISHNVVGNFLM
jgi:hypothetical protein